MGITARKIISCTVTFVFLCQIFLSCSGADVLKPRKSTTGLFDHPEAIASINIHDPGQIHNEILARFCSQHKPHMGNRLPAPEFAQLLVNATNDVFAMHGITARASVKDVALMLRAFIQMKNQGVMNVFSPTRDGLFNALEYAVRKGIISDEASRQYAKALLDTEESELSAETTSRPLRSHIGCSTGNSSRDEAFLDILDHSCAFWNAVDLNGAVAVAVCDTNGPWDPSEQFWLKIAAYGTDALWSFLGLAILPLTVGTSIAMVFAATTASIATECETEDFFDWMDRQLGGGNE